jgi:hypothetical protein
MEDLGNININIRQFGSSGGGGGGASGSGQPGGGPRIPSLPKLPPIQPSAPSAVSQQQGFGGFLEMLKKGSAIKGEIGSFVQSPSAGGFAELLGTSSATGEAIAGLGAAAGVALVAVGAVVAVVGLVVLALKGLQAAAAHTAERIQAVGKYNAEVIGATTTEKIRALQRNLREAAENGHLYAMAQRASTAAADATADVMRDVNKALAALAIVWWKLVELVMRLYQPMAKFLGKLTQIDTNKSVGAIAADVGKMFAQAYMEMQLRFWSPIYHWLGKYIWYFELYANLMDKLLVWLGVIASNTAPKPVMNPNSWFYADVEAVTGRSYSNYAVGNVGSGRSAGSSPVMNPYRAPRSAPPSSGSPAGGNPSNGGSRGGSSSGGNQSKPMSAEERSGEAFRNDSARRLGINYGF